MPSSRRRKFSVQEDSEGRNTSTMSRVGGPISFQHPINHAKSPGFDVKHSKLVIRGVKVYPSSSKAVSSMEVFTEDFVSSSSSALAVRQRVNTVDKDVTAKPFIINLIDKGTDIADSTYVISHPDKRDIRQINRPVHGEKPRQHRIRVRTPKRRMIIQEALSKITVSVSAIDWVHETEVYNLQNQTNVEEAETTEYGGRPSEQSLDDMCRICHGGESLSTELGDLVSACNCRGTVGRVHVRCLERWLTESGKSRCELCGARYATRRIHRYGVPRALLMWVLSQNAKQLMVDSLGIMLMSPLAVLAAWLSGRTLAGLMTQEGHVTPWPLASTFVLACMTLVCYYCWIVSAATRHALGWWIWYRSQYEVRLQLQNNNDAS